MHKNDKDFRNNREPKSKNEAQEQKGQAQKQNDKVQNQKRESTEKKKIRDMVSEISKSRVLLRILLLILGLGFSAIGALIYIYHWNIEGFFVNLEYEDKELAITLTPLLGLLALVVGMYFIARFIKFNATKTKENALYIPKLHSGHETEHINHMVKHTSLSHSRFFAALLMTIMIVINFLKFDFFLSGENHLGCWFSLGGPSLFIPTSAIPTLFAAGLFLYVIFSTAIMRFSASDNFVHIEEY